MLRVYLYPDGKTKYLLRDTGEALFLNAGEQLQQCPDIPLRNRIEEKLAEAEFTKIEKHVPLYPDLAHVHLTRECTLRCEHCYVEGGRDGMMSFSEACYIVDTLAELGVDTVAFGGGEVSLVPYFSQLVEYTTKRGITPTYTTNGHRLCGMLNASSLSTVVSLGMNSPGR